MKISIADIQKYGTDKEKEKLVEGMLNPGLFKIVIGLENMAFEETRDQELSRILINIAKQIENGSLLSTKKGELRLKDINGNSVGEVEWNLNK